MKNAKPSRRAPSEPNKSDAEKQEAQPTGLWNGTISFSLVAIPVSLVRAESPGRISFRLLHRKDHSPLKRAMLCPQENKIVPSDEIIRAFEVTPGRYVEITDDELESVTPERSRTIEITGFIDVGRIDSVYFDHPYYLVPAKGGEKAYALLAEVLQKAKKAGLARFVLREREYLATVTNHKGALALMIMRYAQDVLSGGDFAAGKPSGEDESEIGKTKKLIESMRGNFKPQAYADERRKKIMAFLEKKKKETTPVAAPEIEEEKSEGVVDLVAALQESMRKVKADQSKRRDGHGR